MPPLRKPPQIPKLPHVPKIPLGSADKILGKTAEFTAGSPKLSVKERAELEKLAEKAKKTGRAGLGNTDRIRIVLLMRKAGPESLPSEIPPWLRRLLGMRGEPRKGRKRAHPEVDPLVRIERLHGLRGQPLTEAQYQQELDIVINSPTLGAFSGADQLDRLAKVHKLHEAGALTDDQKAVVTSHILDAG